MTKVVASLSSMGWVTDETFILSYLVSYYILTDGAQSITYQGSLTSLSETYYKYINSPEEMSIAVKNDLENLLSRYFSMVDVETSTKVINKSSKYAVLMYVSVYGESGKLELTKVAEIDTAGLRKVINMNNYGEGTSFLNNF